MTARGDKVPALAAIIEGIAGRIESGSATAEDVETLRKLAAQASGADATWELRVHKKGRGRPKLGPKGVRARFDVARKIAEHRSVHGLPLDQTYRAITKLPGTLGVDSIEKAWKEMGALPEMPEGKRELILAFKELEASGLNVSVKRVTRTKRDKG